jgi:hypothetical protein
VCRRARQARQAAVPPASQGARSALLLPAIAGAALAVALAGCGGSNKSAGSQTSPGTAASQAPDTGTTSSTGPSGASRAPGSTGATTSKGATGATPSTRSTGGASARASKTFGSTKPALRSADVQRLKHFAACLRQHGVDVPPPHTSSAGATLDLKGVDTAAASVRTAEARCAKTLARGVKAKIGPLHLPAPKVQPPGGTVPGGTSGAESR